MRKIFMLLILIIFLRTETFSQLSEDEIRFYLNELDKTEEDLGMVVQNLIWSNVADAIPKLESLFWKTSCNNQTWFLRGLVELGSPRAKEFLEMFIDSLDNPNRIISPPCLEGGLPEQVSAIGLLYELGDYSRVDKVFELWEDDKTRGYLDAYTVQLISEIYKYRIDYRERAKAELLYALANTNNEYDLFSVMLDISNAFNEESLQEMIDLFRTSTIPQVKRAILENYFSRYVDKFDLVGLLRESIFSETSPELRLYYTKVMLYGFGQLSDYKFVKDYLSSEPDDEIINLIWFSLETFRPVTLDDSTKVDDGLSTLKEYVNGTFEFNWLQNNVYKIQLLQNIVDANNYLFSGDSLNCAKEIETFQISVDNVHADSAGSYPKHVSDDAYKFLYYYAGYILDRLPEPPVTSLNIKLIDSQNNYLPGGSLQYYESGWKDAINNGNGTFTVSTEQTKLSLRMTYEYGSQTISNVAVTRDTAVFQTVDATVELRNSENTFLTDSALVKYYASGWRDFGYAVDGAAHKELLPGEYSFRMTYAYASNDKKQDLNENTTVTFSTVNNTVELRNSANNLINEDANVKYYASGWRDFGTTANGIAQKELLPNNYSFRLTYAYASNDKKQDLNENTTVTFSTVNTTVELRDSANNLINEDASVKYYASGWRDFGTTTTGTVQKELLPNNYSFRMTYAFASNDKKQDLNENPIVTFNTVNTIIELRNSQNNLIAEDASVKYYASGWREFGETVSGIAQKELLPNNYSFRMSYAYASNDKKQDLNENTTVTFNTVNTVVELRNSENNLITEDGSVKYYASGWRDFGVTVNGAVQRELLSNNYSFRMTYAFASNDKKQDLNANTIVTFNTVNTIVELRNSENNLINEDASVKYYASGWRDFGATANGTVQKELLPSNYSFRMTHEFLSNDKKQDVGANSAVTFSTVLCTVNVNDSENSPENDALVRYYASGWRDMGLTANGTITKQMLPGDISFRVTKDGVSQDKQQDLNTNPVVQFVLGVEQ